MADHGCTPPAAVRLSELARWLHAAKNDRRITRIGAFLRTWKIDELPQLWNVLIGDMSLVGPRPQIDRYVHIYTQEEYGLLAARPGITDFSSIVFADLAEILEGRADPNLTYLQLVRPWKSRLGLFYIAHPYLWVDMAIIALTALSFISRTHALKGVAWMLKQLEAPHEMVELCLRYKPLIPSAPPGGNEIAS